jgi:hypothetical protein
MTESPAQDQPRVHVAVPVLDERDWLPGCLRSLIGQTYPGFKTWFCVNQPEAWWDDGDQAAICRRNVETLDYLRRDWPIELEVIDRCSRGKGWDAGRCGVGWARKTLMDRICEDAEDNDVIVCMDADTAFGARYIASVVATLEEHPQAVGVAAPYRHPLCGDEDVDRAMLRYEIYLRYYVLNLWRIASPYAFTAMGSVISVPVRAYRAVSGLDPRESGEDFYFLQKLTKYGPVLHWLADTAYPGTRLSSRVPFGTGPAMQRGVEGDWSRYPLYAAGRFDELGDTIKLFPELQQGDHETSVTAFLRQQLKTTDLWSPLRRTHAKPERFKRACHERLDGLRTLQYLKASHADDGRRDEDILREYFATHYPAAADMTDLWSSDGWTFDDLPIERLDRLRDFLEEQENRYRRASTESL